MGQLTEEEARRDPRRHMLRSAVTGDDIDLVDLSARPLRVEPGDYIILASDGLQTLETAEIQRIVAAYADDGAVAVANALIRAVEALKDRSPSKEVLLVWPVSVRRPTLKHAFEQALDEATLDPESGLPAADASERMAPAVGSLGGIAVASGYVGSASLTQAYEASEEQNDDALPRLSPVEAAEKLKAELVEREHSVRDLKELRRRFAARYHPDSVSEDVREEAVTAMAGVNAEIDPR